MDTTQTYPEQLRARVATMPAHHQVAHYNEAIAAALVTYENGVASLTERLRSARQHQLANPSHTEWAQHEQDLLRQLAEWQAKLDAARGIVGYLAEFDQGGELTR